jgi:hypothetical protein
MKRRQFVGLALALALLGVGAVSYRTGFARGKAEESPFGRCVQFDGIKDSLTMTTQAPPMHCVTFNGVTECNTVPAPTPPLRRPLANYGDETKSQPRADQ